MNPPLVKKLDLYASLPSSFRKPHASAWATANRPSAVVDSFLEGPVFDRHGNLYITDIPFGRIFRIDREKQWSLVAEYDGEPNGLKFLGPDTLVIADYKNGLLSLHLESGRISPLLERRNTERFKGVNDLTFDSQGNLYFTDQGQTGMHDPTGRVYRLRRDNGGLDLLLANVPSPNGLVLDRTETILYVAATRGNCVWRVPLLPDGGVSKVGVFFSTNGPSGPDGLALDSLGRLVVANPGIGRVWLLDEYAAPEVILESARGALLTNVAFGGDDHRRIFVTDSSSGSILCTDLQTPGAQVLVGKETPGPAPGR